MKVKNLNLVTFELDEAPIIDIPSARIKITKFNYYPPEKETPISPPTTREIEILEAYEYFEPADLYVKCTAGIIHVLNNDREAYTCCINTLEDYKETLNQ